MNNSSIFTADRATHLKIVVVSLLCATIVARIGIAARVTDTSNVRMEARWGSQVKRGYRRRIHEDQGGSAFLCRIVDSRVGE